MTKKKAVENHRKMWWWIAEKTLERERKVWKYEYFEENKTIPVTVFAYFDGANTNFYLAFANADYTNMVSISGFSCDLVSALTGSLIDVNN